MFTYNQTIHVNLFTLLFGVSMIVLMFLKELSQVQLCIYLNENAANTVILWNIIAIFFFFFCLYMIHLFLWCKTEFSEANTLLFSVTWSNKKFNAEYFWEYRDLQDHNLFKSINNV